MGLKSKIEWTEATWNPWRGCSKVSEGCANCYAERESKRFGRDFSKVTKASEKTFRAPLSWEDPLKIFVCSASDFFHEGADEWREHCWHTIYDARQHTYLILTKRPERISECLPDFGKKEWPWPHVWLGVTAENQQMADERIPKLLTVPAAKRFLSLEPLLESINLTRTVGFPPSVSWIIAGGESGPDARPMHPNWVTFIRDQCVAAGVPFFFKQWGEWAPGQFTGKHEVRLMMDSLSRPGVFMSRVGKKRAGHLLDGMLWDEMP